MVAKPRRLLPCLWLLALPLKVCLAQEIPPRGCGTDLQSIYYNLCDLSAAWGIVLEALASFGIVISFVLTVVLVASVPFIQDPRKKSLIGTQAFFLLGTFGLFCLTFAFIVKQDFSTCASRRFLFGVLFAICFSCLAAHSLSLNFLARQNHSPRGWVIFGVAFLLVLVEVIINAEWLIITVVRNGTASRNPCQVGKPDFVMALIYVMFLQVASFISAWPALCGQYKHWRKHGIFILLTTSLSMAIWVVWIVMYIYGNQQEGRQMWDDPTLAIALVSSAYVFIFFYIIPEISYVIRPGPEQAYEDDIYPTRGVGYETILKEQKSQSMFVENKAFSMDEPSSGMRKHCEAMAISMKASSCGKQHGGGEREKTFEGILAETVKSCFSADWKIPRLVLNHDLKKKKGKVGFVLLHVPIFLSTI